MKDVQFGAACKSQSSRVHYLKCYMIKSYLKFYMFIYNRWKRMIAGRSEEKKPQLFLCG